MNPKKATALDMLVTREGYSRHFIDPVLWLPFIEQVSHRHDLKCTSVHPGKAGTYPTFIVNEEWVIKFFGPLFDGETCWEVELESANLLTAAPEIPVAHVRARGELETVQGWNYLVYSFIPSVSIGEVYQRVTFEDKLAFAHWLGKSLHRMHALEIPSHTSLPRLTAEKQLDWFTKRRGASKQVWPSHLDSQLHDYLALSGTVNETIAHHFIHADLTPDHILGKLENGCWTTLAIIDFGDAMLGNIFYELAALHFDLFKCDKRLLTVFLESYCLSENNRQNFVCKAMHTALMHQFDLFDLLFKQHPQWREIQSLERLAAILWDVNE